MICDTSVQNPPWSWGPPETGFLPWLSRGWSSRALADRCPRGIPGRCEGGHRTHFCRSDLELFQNLWSDFPTRANQGHGTAFYHLWPDLTVNTCLLNPCFSKFVIIWICAFSKQNSSCIEVWKVKVESLPFHSIPFTTCFQGEPRGCSAHHTRCTDGAAAHTALELAVFTYKCTGDIFPYCPYRAATFSYVIFHSMNVS